MDTTLNWPHFGGYIVNFEHSQHLNSGAIVYNFENGVAFGNTMCPSGSCNKNSKQKDSRFERKTSCSLQ